MNIISHKMSEDGIDSPLAGAHQNIAQVRISGILWDRERFILILCCQELMEEDLKRELARNELATKMAMAKENEAQEAKRR